MTAAYTPVLRYLRRRTDAATADDVLGDVLLVMWRRFDDVPQDAAMAWCFGVARGCLANRLRSDARQLRLVDRLLATMPAEPAEDPELYDALGALPEADREVLHLWAWEQLPPREIAVVLGISANAASIRLHRATKKLRKSLEARKSREPAGQLVDRQGEEGRR